MFIYGVAKNGLVGIRTYKVIKETQKTYVLDDIATRRVLKSSMSLEYMRFFLDEKEAQIYYNILQNEVK